VTWHHFIEEQSPLLHVHFLQFATACYKKKNVHHNEKVGVMWFDYVQSCCHFFKYV